MRARLPVFKLTKMFSSFMSLYTKVSTKVNKKYVERSKMTQNENNGKVDKIKFKDFLYGNKRDIFPVHDISVSEACDCL